MITLNLRPIKTMTQQLIKFYVVITLFLVTALHTDISLLQPF